MKYTDEESDYYSEKYGASEDWEIDLVFEDEVNTPVLDEQMLFLSLWLLDSIREWANKDTSLKSSFPESYSIVKNYLTAEKKVTDRILHYLKEEGKIRGINLPNGLDFIMKE